MSTGNRAPPNVTDKEPSIFLLQRARPDGFSATQFTSMNSFSGTEVPSVLSKRSLNGWRLAPMPAADCSNSLQPLVGGRNIFENVRVVSVSQSVARKVPHNLARTAKLHFPSWISYLQQLPKANSQFRAKRGQFGGCELAIVVPHFYFVEVYDSIRSLV